MAREFETIWQARNQALEYLNHDAAAKADLIAQFLDLLDRCIQTLESRSDDSHAAELYGLTALKAKNFAVGSLSLILDGLGQEAGALMRPMIEYTELLAYLRKKPDAIADIRAGRKLPSAGQRAKEIDGIFKDFREHLNQHASHSAYSNHSLSHLRDPGTKRWKLMQIHVPTVLEKNLGDLAVHLYVMLREVLLCVYEQDRQTFLGLGDIYDDLKPKLFQVFSLNDRR